MFPEKREEVINIPSLATDVSFLKLKLVLL